MRVYILTSFGGRYDDSWEHVEGVFASYSAMVTWINKEFKHDGKLLETDSVEGKVKVEDILNFNVDGEYVSTEPGPKPVKEKKVTERKGHTGSSKQRQNY